MARKDRERERQETYEVAKGLEAYRGHVLRKWLISVAGVTFHRVDILPLGVKSSTPLAMTQFPTTEASLERAVSEAKKVVGWFIKYGTDIDAVNIPVDYMARKNDPFDALVMKSSTGKRSVCSSHWARVKAKAIVGECNAIVFGIVLMQRFMSKLQSDGILQGDKFARNQYTMNLMLDSYAPLCCFMGEEVFKDILEHSRPDVILERARLANL